MHFAHLLEVGERGFARGEDGLSQGVQRHSGMSDDESRRNLVQHGIRLGDHGRLRHAGHAGQHRFDFRGGDILAPDLEHVLGPVGEEEVPALAQGHPVARDHIAVHIKSRRSRFRVMQVGMEQRQARNAPDQKLPRLALGARRSVFTQDGDLIFGRAPADGAEGRDIVKAGQNAVGHRLGHPPPAHGLYAEMRLKRGHGHRRRPPAIGVILGDRLALDRLDAEGDHRGPGAAVTQGDVPKARG